MSTTAYRGIWEYGFPVSKRINHSYAVSYYSPQGTDATIYPPNVDMQFLNDSPGALLMQTHMEGTKAFFIYYGTRDNRSSEVVGPFIWGRTNPPADRIEETTEIPPGTTRQVGKAVPGMHSAWFRILEKTPSSQEEKIESYYSIYQARPNFTQVGVAELPSESTETPASELAPGA